VAKNVVSRDELEGAAAKRAKAEAELKMAEIAAEQAKLELSYTRLVSPISGRIGRAQVSVGNMVNSNTVLATIVSLDPMYVYIEMNPAVLTQIRGSGSVAGVTAGVGLEGQEGYPQQGTIDFVDNHVDPRTGAVQVRVAVADREQRLMDGAQARVKISKGRPYRALLINPNAMKFDKKSYVFVANERNVVERRDVEPMSEVDGLIAIRKGLTESDQVIVRGTLSGLRDGMEVETTVAPMEDKNGTP
jgi:multidrug efflux system membrane fusion protein